MNVKRQAASRGLTLLELVMVLAILAVVAGLVIPQVAGLGRTADMAATSKNCADVANNLQLFFVLQKRYPQYMDSLLTTGATPAIYGPTDSTGTPVTSEALQTRGLPVSGPSLYADLTVVDVNTFGTNTRRSFSRLGFDFLQDHDTTVVNSNDSGTVTRTVGSSGTLNLAGVTAGSVIAQKLFPATAGAFPTGVNAVVALGVGPRSTCVPKTMLQAPIYPGCDGKYYGRYIAFFALYNSGERATLVGVSDSYGRNPDYAIQQYNESLPDGGRQG